MDDYPRRDESGGAADVTLTGSPIHVSLHWVCFFLFTCDPFFVFSTGTSSSSTISSSSASFTARLGHLPAAAHHKESSGEQTSHQTRSTPPSPSLLTGLLAFPAASKFDHVLTSCTLATVRRLTNLGGWGDKHQPPAGSCIHGAPSGRLTSQTPQRCLLETPLSLSCSICSEKKVSKIW